MASPVAWPDAVTRPWGKASTDPEGRVEASRGGGHTSQLSDRGRWCEAVEAPTQENSIITSRVADTS